MEQHHHTALALERLSRASWHALAPGEWLPWGPGPRTLDQMAELVNLMGAASDDVLRFVREHESVDADGFIAEPAAHTHLRRNALRIRAAARDIADGGGACLPARTPMHVRALFADTAALLRAAIEFTGDADEATLRRA